MVWKKLTVEKRDVQLPGAPYSVTVHFLDDFVLRGWGHYATCGRRSAGGWATEELAQTGVTVLRHLTISSHPVWKATGCGEFRS
jgi:hypothetical protein